MGAAAPQGGPASQAKPVVLKLQYVGSREGKLFIAAPRLALCVAFALMFWGVYCKFNQDPSYLLRDNRLQWVSTPLAALCVAALLGTAALLCVRLARARAEGRTWTANQRLSVAATALSVLVQLANASFWLTNMAYTWANSCSWFRTVVDVLAGLQWTCWNLLFTLNIIQAAQLLPAGAWHDLAQSALFWWRSRKVARAASAKGGTPIKPPPPASASKLDAAKAMQTHVEWGVRLAALLLIFVPTQVVIGLLTHSTIDDGGGYWDGFTCADVYDPACWPTKGWSCEDYTNPACWPTQASCPSWDWDCQPEGALTGYTWAMGALLNFSAVVFLVLMWLALRELGKRPYHEYRVQNLAARLALRTRVPTYIVFTANMVLTWYIKLGTCTSVLQVWLGLGPMQIAMTATVVVEALLFMPASPDEGGEATRLHDSLQKFGWTEPEAEAVLAARGLPDEPVFCFETALKACYASLHTYRHFNPASTTTSIATARALFGCTHYEWLREPRHDSNCLLMWGPRCLVVAFRGTASMANVKADLTAWRVAHPPRRGSLALGERPLVHAGFLRSWLEAGFNTQVLGRIKEIMEGQAHAGMAAVDGTVDGCCGVAAASQQAAPKAAGSGEGKEAAGLAVRVSAGMAAAEEGAAADASTADLAPGHAKPFRVVLAGHSLGGAMSHLCGIDLAKALPEWGYQLAPWGLPLAPDAAGATGSRPAVSISNYTFGAPRTGNRAFAREFNALVPDSWQVVNGQDVVANQAKFLVLFKRPGKPVLLTRRGDLLVRPSTLEHTAHRVAGAGLKAHMLFGSYCPSLAAVLRGQVAGAKPMPGGREAFEHLALEPATAELLSKLLSLEVGADGGMVRCASAAQLDLEAGQLD